MRNKLPFYLIYSRLALAILIIIVSILQMDAYAIWITVLMSIGLITDIFDGIIARRLQISTEKLRIWDSNVDQFFWISVVASVFCLRWEYFMTHFFWIMVLVILELVSYVLSYGKFKKSIATHSLLAKLWTLSLLWFLVDLILTGTSSISFVVCVLLGFVSRLEIILIILTLKQWATDVPSLLVVSKINSGKPFKKSRWLNS